LNFLAGFETLALEPPPTTGVLHTVETLPKNHDKTVPRDFKTISEKPANRDTLQFDYGGPGGPIKPR
jgi:hypothetical protein